MEPEYPHVTVPLTGEDGNSFVMVSRVRLALSRAGVPEDRCKEFFDTALAGDRHNVWATIMKWVTVE